MCACGGFLWQLVAQVMAQADGQQLGHSGADEHDGSWAQFVISSQANEARIETKGGIKACCSQGCLHGFITRDTRPVYLQSRLPVHKQN